MHVRLTQSEGGHRLEIIKMSEERENGRWALQPGERAHDVEWTLISRLHPEEAATIAARAESKREGGKETYDDIRDVIREELRRSRENGSE